MLLSIVAMSSIMGTTDFDALSKSNFNYVTQLFLFYGIFIAFAVKTPVIFLNTWLLKAHVESPLSGSIILAGKSTMPALNLVNCWENLIRSISRKNFKNIFWEYMFLSIYTSKFFRGHTLETTNENIENKINTSDKNSNLKGNLGSYLAGLIEGDGSIYTSKNDKGGCMIVVVFTSKDLPLALKIKAVLGMGNIYKVKSKNAYTYVISNVLDLLKIIDLINGKMRTPKIKQLYKLIDWINYHKNHNIVKLPLDNTCLGSNSWLAGFIEADGCFYVRCSQNKHANTKKISCMLEIAQKRTNLNNEDIWEIMHKISSFFSTALKRRTKANQYWIRTNSLESNLKLIEYLTKYPLFSSKYMDYISWKEVIEFIKNKEQKEKLNEILKLKESMNSKRTFFNWDHLNKFYL